MFVGVLPIVPPIPGLQESSKVVGLEALHTQVQSVGQKTVILGGGLIGSESAVYLDSLGKEVSVVEMRDDYASDAPGFHKLGLKTYFDKSNVKIYLNTMAKEVTSEGLVCADADGKEFLLEADTILVAAGMHPDTETVDALRYAAPRFIRVGDCIKAGKVHAAVTGGYYGAIDI